jgi:hypothetical protein
MFKQKLLKELDKKTWRPMLCAKAHNQSVFLIPLSVGLKFFAAPRGEISAAL